ncbi:hypothetical protein [Streptomyces sp. MBT28]|uniref:hypothetical protein n=1 Tax=Streptomyces sp. MBT28 TaxID=1488357 RepID=UPI000A417D1A|nr:hypothetical protein [Streptomyces sp. MBT28]
MRIHTIAATGAAVLVLTLSACSSSDNSDERPSETASSAPSSPTADTAAAQRACKDAWRQAVEEGAIDDGTVSVENPPAECDGVEGGAGLAAEAIREHIQEGRKQLEDCMDDPSAPECEGLPIP